MTTKKTSTITFRIDREYEEVLRAEAEARRVSLNTLANQIFGDYVQWQRYMEKFGTIVMSKDAFRAILDSLDESNLVKLAVRIGESAPKEFILFKWKDLSSDSLVKFMKMYFEHCGYGQYDYARDESENTFSIHHDLGRKGSLFLKTFLETAIKSTLGRSCGSTVTENSLTVTFRE
jgi:hypothetical protein